MGQVRESTADPLTRLSFEFLVLTAARSGEVRMSTWSEIGNCSELVRRIGQKWLEKHSAPIFRLC